MQREAHLVWLGAYVRALAMEWCLLISRIGACLCKNSYF